MIAHQAEDQPRTVERKLEIDVPVEAVWKALTDADELMRWFPLQAEVTPGEGGSIRMSWNELYQGDSKIDLWEPNKHLRIRFPLDAIGGLVTDYYLEGEGGSTILRVVTSGFGEGENWDEHLGAVGNGWNFELRGLKHYLERHRGTDRVALWVRGKYSLRHVDAWTRLTGPGGLFGVVGLSDLSVGSGYSARTVIGSDYEGGVLVWNPPRLFVATVHSFNDGLLRLETEGKDGAGRVMLWVSTYGVPEAEVRSMEARWQDAMDSMLAA